MVDLYCLLFNAQGQLIEHVSHSPASNDGAITQEPRHQHGHDQKFVVALHRVNYGIDVIGTPPRATSLRWDMPLGFILSHSEDTISDQSRPLDECAVQCTLHSSNVDAILSHGQGDVLCEHAHSPHDAASGGLFRNAIMVCKLYRDTRQRSQWIFHPICEGMTCASHCIVGLTRCAQLHLVDIIPDIDIPNVTSLRSIQGICSALTSGEFLAFENQFPAGGYNKHAFARCLGEGMVRARPELRSEKHVAALLALLYEMFDQIEFTSFCIALGMISTKQSQVVQGKGVEYSYKQHPCHGKTFPYHITRIKSFDAIRKVAVLEHMSPNISMFDSDGHFLHDMTSIAKTSVMKDGGVYVIDVDHVPAKNCLVVSSSDRTITVWGIVNAVKGQYIQSGKIVVHDMMMVVKWCPMLKLCMTSSTKSTALWNVDTCKVEARLAHHADLVTDIVEIPAARLFATCSFDHNVAVWEADRMKVLFELTGHTQVMLTGHHCALLDVKLIRHHAAKLDCVTGDMSGHFKIWDISRCIVDASRDAGAASVIVANVNVGGNFQVVRLVPEMVASVHSPLQYVLYNQVSHTFTASIAGRITVWSGKSGTIIHEPIAITAADVCGLCFDLPRQRKLFVATSCLITNGADDSLSICSDVQGQGQLDPMRTIDNVHRYGGMSRARPEQTIGSVPMSSCAYSSEHGLIATGDTNGHIRVHDFQRLSLIFRCEGHKGEVTCLSFHRQCCVLFAGDAAGDILVWQVLNVTSVSKCLMRLSYTSAAPTSLPTFVTDHALPPAVSPCGISSICVTEDSAHSFASIVAADDVGHVHCWSLRSIRQHTRGVMKIHFDPLPETMIAYARGGYNPNLRISRRQSVMAPSAAEHSREPRQKYHRGRTSSPRVSDAMSWKAHDSKILQVHPLQFPGFFYSYDDGGVRLWDTEGGCLGTLQRRFEEAESQPMQWQYRSSVLLVDNSTTIKQHAVDILKAVADDGEYVGPADSLNADDAAALETQDVTGYLNEHASRTPRTMRRHQSLANAMEKVKAVKIDDPGLGAVLDGLRIKAEHDRAFSSTSGNDNDARPTARCAGLSVKAGIQDNMFTQDEAYMLESVGRDALQRRNYETILFPPLLLTTAQIKKAYAKAFSSPPCKDDAPSGVDDLPMLRTCDNFAVEVAARRLKQSTGPQASRHQLSIEPSAFLKLHLKTDTPTKKKPKRRAESKKPPHAAQHAIAMETFVAKTPDKAVGVLPRLSSRSFGMQKSASMPALHVQAEASRQDADDDDDGSWRDHVPADTNGCDGGGMQTSRQDAHVEIRPEVKQNILRKMTLCESMRHESRVKKPAVSRMKMEAKRRPPIDPVEWAKAGKNPFGPHYSVREVLEFGGERKDSESDGRERVCALETLLRFDKDLSGDIDTDEWMKIMTAFMPKAHDADVAVAKELFATVDANEDGLISLNELLHIVVCALVHIDASDELMGVRLV
ncbi:hypothetical protein DYB32_001259 [Aphanomyces invadans]|uniref:EF-hand domain-containing protein n=1 Tax=Aphanomyces invadans TaxID=157072 RepID=A0A3R6Z9N1_9STRA|nr:hypothetical protein DYB32_001259 [Aphanomyces invadans]